MYTDLYLARMQLALPLADNPEEVVEHGSVGLAGGAGQLSQLPHVLDDNGGEQPYVGLPYTA